MSGSPPAILHVDMDAFYASVEVLHDPSLAGRPLIVGGSGDRGVVASCSYEARAYGISSAMPSARARRLCPHAVFVPGDHRRYREYSRRMHEVFSSFTPLVEGVALDEAFLDVTGARRLFGPPGAIAAAIRDRLGDELRLSASVGVGASKLVAKLASRQAKPRAARSGPVPGRGVVVVEPGRELDMLHPLPVSSLWGVGPAGAERLRRLGVKTVGDLAALPLPTLVAALGDAAGRHLHELAWGRDHSPVEPDRPAKSVGHEETYARDLVDRGDIRREIVRLSDLVAGRLQAACSVGRTVSVKLRFPDFVTITRSQTQADGVDSGPELARVALSVLEHVELTRGVRLLGVSVSNLSADRTHQPDLWGGEKPWSDAWRAVHLVRRRYGGGAVRPATLLEGRRVVDG